MTVAIPAPLAKPRLRIDLFRPAFVLLVAGAGRAGGAAAVMAAVLQPGRQGRRVHAGELRRAGERRHLAPAVRAGDRDGAGRRRPVVRHRDAAGMAGVAHRPAGAARGPRAGDGVVRHAAVSRRDRLGNPRRPEQRPGQRAVPLSGRRAAVRRAAGQHLHLAGPDLRDRLLHLSLRLHAGGQRAGPRARPTSKTRRRSSAAGRRPRCGASPFRWCCPRCWPAR